MSERESMTLRKELKIIKNTKGDTNNSVQLSKCAISKLANCSRADTVAMNNEILLFYMDNGRKIPMRILKLMNDDLLFISEFISIMGNLNIHIDKLNISRDRLSFLDRFKPINTFEVFPWGGRYKCIETNNEWYNSFVEPTFSECYLLSEDIERLLAGCYNVKKILTIISDVINKLIILYNEYDNQVKLDKNDCNIPILFGMISMVLSSISVMVDTCYTSSYISMMVHTQLTTWQNKVHKSINNKK